jgi:hypothetical protein
MASIKTIISHRLINVRIRRRSIVSLPIALLQDLHDRTHWEPSSQEFHHAGIYDCVNFLEVLIKIGKNTKDGEVSVKE